MPTPASQRQPLPQSEARDSTVLVDVLVLSSDLLLFDAIRGAIGERNPVWRARSAEESVDLLMTGRCGVLLVDMGAVSIQPTALISQIVEQFPDVVVVVAGRREDEALLAQLISDGHVFRFMHKPLTAKRAGMFLQAATRRHVEQRQARTTQSLLPLATVLPSRFDAAKWLFVAAGVGLFVWLLWMFGADHKPRASATTDIAATPIAPAAAVRTSPQADPVLSRARAAFAAGRYEAPAGRNALDLYAAVLLARPDQAEARAGLDETMDRVAGLARLAAADGNHEEAKRLLARLQSADAASPAVTRLASYLAPPQQPPAAAPVPAVSIPAASPPATTTATTLAPATATAPTAPPTATATASTAPPTATATASTAPPKLAATNTPLPQAPPPAVQRTAPKAKSQPPIVRPDPLTPAIVNADTLRASSRPRTVRKFGAPISPGLPIAGYVKSRPPEQAATQPSPPTLDPAVAAALSQPADEFDRVYATDPVYPAAALRDRVEGWVELMFTITETGAVRDIEVVAAEPRGVFESAASDALGNWRFKPRLANGQPVAHRSTVTLRFNVDD